MLTARWRYLCVFWAVLVSAMTLSAQPQRIGSAPMELRHGVPFVRVMVNGHGPYLFGVDTGTSNEAIVSPTLVAALGLPVVDHKTLSDLSGQHVQQVEEVAVDSLTVAHVDFRGVRAVVHAPISSEGAYDGILGFQLFRNLVLTLDYPHQQLALSQGELTDAEDASVQPMLLMHGVPMVRLAMGNMLVDAQIDSGGTGLCLPASVARTMKFYGGIDVIGRGRSQVGSFELLGGTLRGRIQMASYEFKEPFIEVSPVFPIANLGAVALQVFAITFDQAHKRIQFQADSHTLRISRSQMQALTESSAGVPFTRMVASAGF